MDDLTKAIDKLLNEKTFTVEAVRGIEELRKRAERMEQELKGTTDLSAKYEKESEKLRSENAVLKAREAALAEREKKMTDLERTAAVEAAKTAVWSECFTKIFANRVVREHVNDSVPLMNQQGYVQRDYSSKDVTREEG